MNQIIRGNLENEADVSHNLWQLNRKHVDRLFFSQPIGIASGILLHVFHGYRGDTVGIFHGGMIGYVMIHNL